jgi:hypothetical protein
LWFFSLEEIDMGIWKKRIVGFIIGFTIGLLSLLIYNFIAGFFVSKPIENNKKEAISTGVSEDCFSNPEEILASMKSPDVGVRRSIFKRLFFRHVVSTIYYDYERDLNYPERAERAQIQYLNLDDSVEDEAVITFLRMESPVALVLKKGSCGWRPVAALSAWLRNEDYPYSNWIEFPETVRRGVHEILIRESSGDASQYFRKVHLLKLINGSLSQVIEFEEESMRPLESYAESDWSDVKHHRTIQYRFKIDPVEQVSGFELEAVDELIKFTGKTEANSFFMETDGSWHTNQRHWRTRDFEIVKILNISAKRFVWDEQSLKFSLVYEK